MLFLRRETFERTFEPCSQVEVRCGAALPTRESAGLSLSGLECLDVTNNTKEPHRHHSERGHSDTDPCAKPTPLETQHPLLFTILFTTSVLSIKLALFQQQSLVALHTYANPARGLLFSRGSALSQHTLLVLALATRKGQLVSKWLNHIVAVRLLLIDGLRVDKVVHIFHVGALQTRMGGWVGNTEQQAGRLVLVMLVSTHIRRCLERPLGSSLYRRC